MGHQKSHLLISPFYIFQPSSCLSDKEEDEIYGFGYGAFGRQMLQQRQQKLALSTQNSTSTGIQQHPFQRYANLFIPFSCISCYVKSNKYETKKHTLFSHSKYITCAKIHFPYIICVHIFANILRENIKIDEYGFICIPSSGRIAFARARPYLLHYENTR